MIAVALSSWALNVGDTFNNGDYTYEVKVAATSSSAGKIAVKRYNNTTATSSKIALSLVGPDDKIYDINEIGEYAYYGRSNITNITIGSNIQYIEFEAFSGTNIKALEIPSAVTYISIGFAISCEKLEKITVDEWNKQFASYDGALYTKDLTKLRTMPAAKKIAVYPSQLTTIGSYAFANSTMETIDIPFGVTTLDMMPFYYINSKAVVIPSSVKDFYVTSDGEGPFWGRANLNEIDVYLNTTSVPIEKANEFATSALRQDINLHVRRELASEFKSKWSGFKSINADHRVGFDLSKGKLDFSINSTEPCTIDGTKYDGRASVVPGINYGNVSGENNIPFVLSIRGKYYAVTKIADFAFRYSNPTKFTGGENVDSIGYSSFYDCKNLTSVSLPNLSYIRQYAFMECSSLTSFAFNKNLKEIEPDAFFDSGLSGDVVLPYGFESLGNRAFSGTKVKRLFVPKIKFYNSEMFKGMSSLTELYLNTIDISGKSNIDLTGIPSTCSLHVAYKYIDSYKAKPVWNNAFKTITSGACDFTYGSSTSNAFSSPYRITVLSNTPFTEDGVEYAGTAMYVNYPGMGNMTAFMASSRELNQFYGADKRYKMTGIGDHCFEGATNMVDPGLDKMTFLETIGDYAFNGLSSMTEIKIPAQVSYIGENAFAGCSKLTSIIAEPTTPPTVKANTLSNLYYQATLKVHSSCLAQYKAADYWKNFFKIESIEGDSGVKGDVDGNGVVNITDANILINIILGKDSADNYGGRADVDGNGTVNITDANILINLILGK